MTQRVWLWLVGTLALLFVTATASAQEAVIGGAVTDATGAALPGVTVTATHDATGNTFVAVTNEQGSFRMSARVGTYRLTLELQGFATLNRAGLELLAGQTADLKLEMALTTLEESVTVSAEAPLLNVTQSSMGGNIDPRQMQELPVQGRNWTSLALLAPGNRTTAEGANPVADRGDVRDFQMNMDGQQVTSNLGPGGQPRFSRDAIAEFQFISNRFDATQGRSAGVQVNAISRSGTNLFAGSFGSYFRNSDWNAADPVLNRVVPYEDQQYSFTFGGPIQRDRMHFFANYEYQRQPQTTIANTAWQAFNIELSGITRVHMGGVRLDYQLSPQNRLMLKGDIADFYRPFGTLGANHPGGTNDEANKSNNLYAQLTQVLGNAATNQVKLGYSSHGFSRKQLARWQGSWMAPDVTIGSPRIQFTGFRVGGDGGLSLPQVSYQDAYSLRDDFTLIYDARGQHNLKAGAEFIFLKQMDRSATAGLGVIDAQGGPIPANIEALFPDPFNVDTWNLAAISPLVRRYTLSVGPRPTGIDRPTFGAWVQDDWRITTKLTLNLGLRYDLLWNAFANDVEALPWVIGGRPNDVDNFQPRAGFAYQWNDRTVVRGGIGKYYGEPIGSAWLWTQRFRNLVYMGVPNDGRPDFAANPFNGPVPTIEQALARACDLNNNAPGCLERDGVELAPPAKFSNLNQSWQGSIGFQRQLGSTMVLEADYAFTKARDEKALHHNANLTYDRATGVNYPFANRATRYYPLWGTVGYYAHNGRSTYQGLQVAFTKRMSSRWQASANYLLSGLWNVDPPQPISGHDVVDFPVAIDLGNEWGLARTDQRHRLVFNGIWQVGRGFQASGLYFFGSGQRLQTGCGGDRRGISTSGTDFLNRLCADGSIVPFNSFVMDQVHRVDLRLQQRLPLIGRARIEGIVEIYNVLDRANFGSYTTDRSSPRYGLPNASTNLSFAPRTLQVGFRILY